MNKKNEGVGVNANLDKAYIPNYYFFWHPSLKLKKKWIDSRSRSKWGKF